MAMDIAMILALVGFAIGAYKMKKLGVAEALVAIGVILGNTVITATAAGLPVVGGIVAMLYGAITGFAVGALLRTGAEMLMKKASL